MSESHDEAKSQDRPQPDGDPPKDLTLRARRKVEAPPAADAKRFDIFLIDTGWNQPVSRGVHRHLSILHEFHPNDTIYVLTPEQSVKALKNAPYLIGHDPTIVVFDLYASHERSSGNYRGFRLNLGLMRSPEQALARLQEFSRFLAQHRTACCLECEVQQQLHREGVSGMIKILRDGLEKSIELV